MKKLLMLMVMLFPAVSFAQTTSTANAKSNSGAFSGSSLTQNYAGSDHYSGSYKINNVPALGTIIATPTAPCMGAVGGQIAIAGFGGGLVGTRENKACMSLEEIRATWNMQQHGTALLMMCKFKSFRDARALQGMPCPAYYDKNKQLPIKTKPVATATVNQDPAPTTASTQNKPVNASVITVPSWKQKLCAENPVKPGDKPYVQYYCH